MPGGGDAFPDFGVICERREHIIGYSFVGAIHEYEKKKWSQ